MTEMMMDELFPLVDEAGNVVGRATRRECHSGTKRLHPVVHLQLFNSQGELYLQKRALNKDIQPGKWDTAVGGHFAVGENAEEAVIRESREELNIELLHAQLVDKYVFESEIERELVYVFTVIYDGEITPDGVELEGGRFWSINEISDNIGKGIFTPNFEGEFVRRRDLFQK